MKICSRVPEKRVLSSKLSSEKEATVHNYLFIQFKKRSKHNANKQIMINPLYLGCETVCADLLESCNTWETHLQSLKILKYPIARLPIVAFISAESTSGRDFCITAVETSR